ncbi:uncharacterized protein JCM6883_002001 [Sporobolomyces salmoneus]|uniref:uncharacterized protein n=1 Tax=Sporobolomyces salmoneus TaxID=183962 RepID=UPI003177000A
MSGNPPRTSLSHLPPELLADVFDYAYITSKPPSAPISRALLPLQRQALFRRIQISSHSQFQQLMQACDRNSGLGRLVKVFEVEKIDPEKGESRNDRQTKGFITNLVNLEELKLGSRSTSLVDLVLSIRIARSNLPRLETLKLVIPFEWKKPFDSKIYRHLNEFPSLHRLEFSDTTTTNPFTCSLEGGQKLAKITELVLKGFLVDTPRTSSFLDNFPNLASLTLDTLGNYDPDYSNLVALLPESLSSLTLLIVDFYDDYLKACDQHFPRLVNLEYLYLSEGTFTENLIDSLQQLTKLKTLGFGRGAILDCSKLEEMLLGPNRLPSIEKLIFDQVEGKTGWRICFDSDGTTLHPDFAKYPLHTGPGWSVPRWGKHPKGTLHEGDCIKLVERIRSQGVKVEGTSIEAFGILDEWGIESSSCVIAHGITTGDFSECVEMFGQEYVDKYLLGIGMDDGPEQYDGLGDL